MPISVFTLFTASTASPSEASGARLNESVTTGNWPWWFTVIGALDVSTCVKALSGTCPPFGNAVEEEIPLPNAVLEAIVGLLAEAAVERSEEHTSELQSLRHLVCRLLLEKKK